MKTPSIPLKTLSIGILSTDMSFIPSDIQSWDGDLLTATDFNTVGYGAFFNASRSKIEFFTFDPATVVNSSITILTRGNGYSGGTVDGEQTKYDWNSNETLIAIGTNPPGLFTQLVDLASAQTIPGVKTFTASPLVPGGATGSQAVNSDQLTSATFSGASDASTTVTGITRASVSSDTSIGTFTVTIASPGVFTLNSHGLTINDSVRFTTTGALPTGLVAGTTYYIISAGLTTNNFEVSTARGGSAVNTTGSQSGTHTLIKTTPTLVGTLDGRIPTQSENDALVGTNGAPSSGNPYVTSSDVASAATASKVARRNSLGDVQVNTTPTNSTDAASKAYADTKLTGFGSWGSATADGAGHQVLTDGLLLVTNASGSTVTVLSDSASTPTTVRAISTPAGGGQLNTVTVPIKKNDYYKITGTATNALFISLS